MSFKHLLHAALALLITPVSWGQTPIVSLAISPPCPVPSLTLPAGSTATLLWSPPTKNTDGTAVTDPVTYNIYNIATNNPAILVSGLTTTSATRTNLDPGIKCYALTATYAKYGTESKPMSVSILVSAPSPTPNPPSNITCTFTVPIGGGTPTGNCVAQ